MSVEFNVDDRVVVENSSGYLRGVGKVVVVSANKEMLIVKWEDSQWEDELVYSCCRVAGDSTAKRSIRLTDVYSPPDTSSSSVRMSSRKKAKTKRSHSVEPKGSRGISKKEILAVIEE